MQIRSPVYIFLAALQVALYATALAVQSEDSEKGLERRVFVADDILITGLVVLSIGVISSMIVRAAANYGHSVSVSGQYIETTGPTFPASAYAAAGNLAHRIYNQNSNLRVVAVKAFVVVTGTESLGAVGQDWGSAWVPIQTSATTATTYVVWWTTKRGAVLTINSGNSADYAVSPGVGMNLEGYGLPMTVYL